MPFASRGSFTEGTWITASLRGYASQFLTSKPGTISSASPGCAKGMALTCAPEKVLTLDAVSGVFG
jgi:hypothetical protein